LNIEVFDLVQPVGQIVEGFSVVEAETEADGV
jgi:hypothetical protein